MLNEAIIKLSDLPTKKFLHSWTRGDMSAAFKITPEIIENLKPTIQDTNYVLYRGWKFASVREVREKLNVEFSELDVGDSFKLKTDKMRSWSKSRDVADNFSNPRFDSITGIEMHDDHLDDMGYRHGETLGYSVLLQITVKSDSVIADLENVPPSIMEHGHEESEVILKPGVYTVHVISASEHVHVSQKHVDEAAAVEIVGKTLKKIKFVAGDKFTFDEMLEKFDHLLSDEEAITMAMIYGFGLDDEEVLNKIEHHRIHDHNQLYNSLIKYIRNFIRTGEDPQYLSKTYKHIMKREVTTNRFLDSNFDFNWEPEN